MVLTRASSRTNKDTAVETSEIENKIMESGGDGRDTLVERCSSPVHRADSQTPDRCASVEESVSAMDDIQVMDEQALSQSEPTPEPISVFPLDRSPATDRVCTTRDGLISSPSSTCELVLLNEFQAAYERSPSSDTILDPVNADNETQSLESESPPAVILQEFMTEMAVWQEDMESDIRARLQTYREGLRPQASNPVTLAMSNSGIGVGQKVTITEVLESGQLSVYDKIRVDEQKIKTLESRVELLDAVVDDLLELLESYKDQARETCDWTEQWV